MIIYKNKRIENLDLLRAFAILIVVYFHSVQMIFGEFIVDKALFNLGKFGVNVFFVLSGFLICTIYLKDRDINPGKFWLNRFLRIYPPYIFMLFVSWLAVASFRIEKFDWGYLLLIQNFYINIPYFLVSWSLCIEEHFYILFSLIIFAIPNVKSQKIFWISVLIISCVCRFLLGTSNIESFGYYSTATYFQMDSLSFGVLAAYFVKEQSLKIKTSTISISLLFTSFIGIAYILSTYSNSLILTFGLTVLNGIITLLLIQLYHHKTLYIAKTPFINLLAKMAFSIYLVHPLCIHFGRFIFKKDVVIDLSALYIAIVLMIFGTSFIFYKTIEKPSLNLRNKLMNNSKPIESHPNYTSL